MKKDYKKKYTTLALDVMSFALKHVGDMEPEHFQELGKILLKD